MFPLYPPTPGKPHHFGLLFSLHRLLFKSFFFLSLILISHCLQDYGTVVIRWTTHDAGSSVTKRDVEMAEWCEEMAKALGTADDATTAKK